MSEISETNRDSLHSAIMSIPVEAHQETNRDYKIGHRAALHSAAELAAEFMSPPRMNGCRIGSHVPHRRAAMSELTDQRLDEIEAIANTATPGPLDVAEGDLYDSEGTDRWSVVKDVGGAKYFVATVENGCPGDTLETEKANAELFALARTAVPELIQEVRRLRESEQIIGECFGMIRETMNALFGESPATPPMFLNDWISCEVAKLKAMSPSWQDRPTGPGMWMKRSGTVVMVVPHDMGQRHIEQWPGGRVFGPIPADESNPTKGTETK